MTQKISLMTFVILCFFFIVVFAVYWPTVYADFISDDNAFITDNPHIKSVRNIPSFFLDRRTISAKKDWGTIYRPLRTTTYTLEFSLWELDPIGYHLVNIILHGLNVFLLFCLLKRLTNHGMSALLISTLFAIHPVHTEVVAWVSSRGDLLYMFFFLLAFLFFVRSISWSRTRSPEFIFRYGLSISSFLCGLFSKEMIVSLPPLLILWALLLARKEERKRAVVLTLPFFLLIAAYLVLKFIILENTSQYGFPGGSYWITLLSMSSVFYHYVKLMFVPYPLIFCYFGIPLTKSIFSIEVWAGILLLVSLLFLAAVFYRKKRPDLTFFILWFLLTFAPVSNLLVPINTLMAERFLYLPSIGFLAAITLFLRSYTKGRWLQVLLLVMTTAVIVFFMVLTFQRSLQWTVPEELFSHDIKHWPRTILSRYGLVEIFSERQQYQKVRELLTPLREWYPTSVDVYAAFAQVSLAEMKLDEAEKNVRHGLSLDPEYEILYNLSGLIYKKRHNMAAAIDRFTRALEVHPHYVEALNNLASIAIDRGQYQIAQSYIQRAFTINPHHATVLENAANLAIRQGDFTAAGQYLAKRRRVAAQNHMVLFLEGNLFERRHDMRKALLYWLHSIAHGMKDPMVLYNIGTAYLNLNNPYPSIRYFEKLFRETPDFHLSKSNWCIALYQAGRVREATTILEQQLQLQPDDNNVRKNLELMKQGSE